MNIKERLDKLPGIVSDILFVIVVVSVVSILSQLALGLWTPMVAVESGSMVPNLNIGDIIVVQGATRTNVITWEDGEASGYKSFNLPGDVILYRPYGKDKPSLLDQGKAILGLPLSPTKATPIIHRALSFVQDGEPMWDGGPPAPFSGYVTKGDHNELIDQKAGRIFGVANPTYLNDHKNEIKKVANSTYLDEETGLIIYEINNQTYVGEGISYLAPVKPEWVIGVARAKIPIVGYIRLLPNIIAGEIQKLLGG
jgi:signal peptidase I